MLKAGVAHEFHTRAVCDWQELSKLFCMKDAQDQWERELDQELSTTEWVKRTSSHPGIQQEPPKGDSEVGPLQRVEHRPHMLSEYLVIIRY